MKNTFEEFQSSWKNSRSNMETSQDRIDNLISSASARKRSNVLFHYGNIAVLSVTVVALVVVWRLWLPFQETLSKVGISIMIGGLVLRIGIEIISAFRSRNINMADSLADSSQEMIRYYSFRKGVHGPVTVSIIVAYLLGLCALLPELSRYISAVLLTVFMAAFVLSGLFIIYKVRQSIRTEMDNLRFFMDMNRQLSEG